MAVTRDTLEAQYLAMLLDEPSLIKLSPIDASDFADPTHSKIYQTLVDMTLDVTPITVSHELEQCGFSTAIPYVEELWDLAPSDTTIETLKLRSNKIRENHIRRVAASKLEKQLRILNDPQQDLQGQISQVSAILTDAGKGLLGQDSPTVDKIIERAHQQVKGVRFPSGLTGIDSSLTAHGMRHGHVWLLVAPYKNFKTATALNTVHNLLEDKRSVAYIALEDNDIAFTEVLTAIHSAAPLATIEDLHVEKIPSPQHFSQAIIDAEDWLTNIVGDKFRVYDAQKHPVHSWKSFPTLVAIDKSLYNTDVIVVDYLQAWAEEHEDLAQISQMLVKVAAENQVCLLVLSQMSNETILKGSNDNMLGTKGSGSLGQAAHVGIEIKCDKQTSWGKYSPALQQELATLGVNHFLSMTSGPAFQGSPTPSDVVEIGLWLKTVRRGRVTRQYMLIDPVSQKVLLQYSQPRFMAQP